jgi:hypothetical protein
VSVADRDESPPLAEVDQVGIKPEPASPGGRAASMAGDEEDEEMKIKDFKPSVDVTFKGKSSPTMLCRHCRLICRLWYFLVTACLDYRAISSPTA